MFVTTKQMILSDPLTRYNIQDKLRSDLIRPLENGQQTFQPCINHIDHVKQNILDATDATDATEKI
jgi:cell division FtsZ-interacting protein ZapD